MKTYGLIGFPLDHSMSPEIFREIFTREGIADAEYKLFPLRDINTVRALVRANDLSGISVTIPYKTAIIPYLDDLDEESKSIGAVNTVKIGYQNGKLFLKGYNTDAPAFAETIRTLLPDGRLKALVLGSGGASRAVCSALERMKISCNIVTRGISKTSQFIYGLLTTEIIKNHLLIINTTPLGMFPDNKSYPSIPYEGFSNKHLAYDLVYNPDETVFLKKAKLRGARTKNGMEMLKAQAELGWKIWSKEMR